MGLEDIIKNNHYPIVFIGSGMSKRYIKSFPNWSGLLEEYWNKLGESQNFYSFLRKFDDEFTQKNGIDAPDNKRNFYTNGRLQEIT